MLRTDQAGLADFLSHPFLDEELGASNCPLVVLELADPHHPLDEQQVAALRALPAVVAGFVESAADPSASDATVAAACDLLVADSNPVEEQVSVSPQAAVTLAQLLRMTEHLSVRDALVAESLAYSTLQSGPKYQAWLAKRSARDSTPRADHPDSVIVDHLDGEMVITFNRPDRHNAFSAEMRDLLVEALRVAASADLDVTIRGAGPSFCSGGDLDEFGSTPDSATAHMIRSTRSAPWWVHQRQDRIRFELHGSCYGAGIELAAFASDVQAHPGTTLALPEIAFGLIPGAGGTVSVTRRIGRQRTMELALSSAPIDAPTALAWGLIDWVASPL